MTIGGTITTFPDFADLEVVEGNLTISGITTATLIDLNGIFPSLTSIEGNLIIQNNANVETISGFALLESVDGDVNIGIPGPPQVGNPALTSLPSFALLETIGGTLRFVLNPNLGVLPPFNALTNVGGIVIVNNAALKSILSFRDLRNLGGVLTVQDNAALYLCCGLLRLVDDRVQPTGTTTISGNATGCSSDTEITDACVISLMISSVDDVPSNASSLLGIAGDLTIGGTIDAFPDFASLEFVRGDIRIVGITEPTLTELNGIFPSLDTIQGSLIIFDNNIIETITGFAALESIGVNLEIGGSDRYGGSANEMIGNLLLRSIPDFAALKGVGEDIIIGNHEALTTVSGFGALTSLGGRLLIDDNSVLTTIDGFGVLPSARSILIIRNAKLATVSGFDVLETIIGGLRIGDFRDPTSGNPLLTSLPTFSVLTSIGSSLDIVGSGALSALPPFAVLKSIGEDLYLQGNFGPFGLFGL